MIWLVKEVLKNFIKFFVLSWPVICGAVGLQTSFIEVLVENLRIGQQTCITKIANFPLVVENISKSEHYIKIEPIIPTENRVTTDTTYTPIPDINWVKIVPDVVKCGPNEKAIADIYIKVPYEERYAGGNYYFKIWSHIAPSAAGGVGIGVGVVSRVLLKLSDFVADFDIKPNTVKKYVKCGKVIELADIKLENLTDESMDFKLKVTETTLPNPNFVILLKDEVTVSPKTSIKLPVYVAIPPGKEYRKKEYYGVLSVAPVLYDTSKKIEFLLKTK